MQQGPRQRADASPRAAQGHAHPRIVAALSAQAARLGLVSRAFTNDAFGPYAEFITRLFGYDKARRHAPQPRHAPTRLQTR